MKKVISILMLFCLFVPMMHADGIPESLNKQLLKAQKKQAKKKEKEYKKAGFEIMGSNTMEVALLKHYLRLAELGNNGMEFDGVATKTKSKNLGEQMALNAATLKYAQKAGSTVKGRVVSEMFNEDIKGRGELDKFYATYERLVETKVKDALVPSYSVMKTNPDGTYEIHSFFIVDESDGRKARQAALESAIAESELGSKYADIIRGIVNEKIQD